MFGYKLRLEAAVAVTRNLDGQDTKIAFECLGAAAIARVAAVVGYGLMLVVPEVRR